MDLTVTKQTLSAGGFKHWKTDRGSKSMETITLSVAGFTKATHYADGVLKAGIALAKVTASGLYVPYAGAAAEVQHLNVDATSGNWTATIEGETTANIAFNATAAAVQAALEALSGVDIGDVVVTGGPGASGNPTPYIVTFAGKWAGKNAPAITTADVSLAGGGDTTTGTTTTAGGGSGSGGTEVCVGLLGDRCRVDLVNVPTLLVAQLQWEGNIIEANLPIAGAATGGGYIDSSAKAQLGSTFRWS